jgi:mRNA-degrading endonuclease RelE of RelBE toxin-antitoxin system
LKRRAPAGHGKEPTPKSTPSGPLRLARTESFVRDFRALPKEIQARTEKAILRLVQNPSYPSLRVKKMHGLEDIWEARVTMSYRLTFQRAGDAIILRRVGTPDLLKREIG